VVGRSDSKKIVKISKRIESYHSKYTLHILAHTHAHAYNIQMSLSILNDIILPVLRFDKFTIAETARNPQARKYALLLLISAGFARPFTITVGDAIDLDTDFETKQHADNFVKFACK
jgi:hypothetical protein